MENTGVHDFHFVMDRGMKERLKSLDFFSKTMSLSGIMVKILQLLTPLIEKEHKWGNQQMSRYLPVCSDPEEIRDHVHIYIPDELYRVLKVLHQDLNFYSIAQLIRGLVSFFMVMAAVFKNKVIQEIKKVFARWKKEDADVRLTPREIVRQLWKIIRFLPGKNRLVTVYTNNYSPFWVFRI